MNYYDNFSRDDTYSAFCERSSPCLYPLDRYDKDGNVVSVNLLQVHFDTSQGTINITDIVCNNVPFECSRDEQNEILAYLNNTCEL